MESPMISRSRTFSIIENEETDNHRPKVECYGFKLTPIRDYKINVYSILEKILFPECHMFH